MKVCRLCRRELPEESFHQRKGSPDGLRGECRECNLDRQRQYRQRERDRETARYKRRYDTHREEIVEQRREFRARERDRINAERRARHAANPERNRALAQARYRDDPEPVIERVKRRDFRRRNVKIEALVERDGMVCGICRLPLESTADADIDHIVPRSLGGPNGLDNLQLAHVYCNRAKNNRVATAA